MDAKWYWKTDTGHWHLYPPAICQQLEDAFHAKATKFPVDSERFVDTVKMEQRRMDFTGKPREVKREAKGALADHVLAIVGKTRSNLVQTISDNGGIATPFITQKVTLVVCNDVLSNSELMLEAVELNIVVISENGIDEIIKNKSKADLSPFKADLSVLSGPSNPINPHQLLSEDDLYAESWKIKYSRPMDESTEWYGAFTRSPATPIPIIMELHQFFSSGLFNGVIRFPTLTNSRLQVFGRLTPGGGPPTSNAEASHTLVLWMEHVADGDSSMKINSKLAHHQFTGFLDQVTKSFKVSDARQKTVITLSYVRHFPSQSLAFLQPGTTWKGSTETDSSNFKLEITSKSGDSWNGRVTWPELELIFESTGKILPSGEVNFHEKELLSKPENNGDDEFEYPKITNYQCKMVKGLSGPPTMAGSWQSIQADDSQTKGKFTMNKDDV